MDTRLSLAVKEVIVCRVSNRASAPPRLANNIHISMYLTSAIQFRFPSREARLFPIASKLAGARRSSDRSNVLERVDADHRVKMAVDAAGDDRHYAAARAGVELGGAGAECVFGYQGGSLTPPPERRAD